MKNKTIIIILVVLGIVLAVLVGIYFLRQSKSLSNFSDNATQRNLNNAPVNSVSENAATNQVSSPNLGGSTNDAGINKQTNTEQPQNKLVTNDFEITLPAGWQKTTPVMGASAMAVNANEQLNDPAAQKINFKSYVAISYDTLQVKSLNEYLQTVKNQLSQTISNVVFNNEQDLMINGRSARAIEAELTQQGVNYKILMVAVAGKGDDVWVISFNTIKSSWAGYREIFYTTAKSFSLKK